MSLLQNRWRYTRKAGCIPMSPKPDSAAIPCRSNVKSRGRWRGLKRALPHDCAIRSSHASQASDVFRRQRRRIVYSEANTTACLSVARRGSDARCQPVEISVSRWRHVVALMSTDSIRESLASAKRNARRSSVPGHQGRTHEAVRPMIARPRTSSRNSTATGC